jgi:NADH:ubiquinone oxidoreductase subunit F (NADH-binding)
MTMSLLTGQPARLALDDEPGLLERLLEVLSAADLRGRGGAAFPTATKIASARGRRPRLIVNVCDSEPLAAKDGLLLRVAPGLVADGTALIARAVGAREVVLAVHAGSRSEQYGRNLLAQNGQLWSSARLLAVPDRYVSGEATALASALQTFDAHLSAHAAGFCDAGQPAELAMAGAR